MPNLKIGYIYRDADNYKNPNRVIVKGIITEEQKKEILESCDFDGEIYFFIPSQVGLPEERFSKITSADHCWFELNEDSFESTYEETTIEMTAEELVENFKKMSGNWDETQFEWTEDEEEEEE